MNWFSFEISVTFFSQTSGKEKKRKEKEPIGLMDHGKDLK